MWNGANKIHLSELLSGTKSRTSTLVIPATAAGTIATTVIHIRRSSVTNGFYWGRYAQSCLTLCDPTDCSSPGFSVHGIFLVQILEWIAISSSRGPFWSRDRNCVSCITGGFLTTEPLGVAGRIITHNKTHISVYLLMTFDKYMHPCNHHLNQDLGYLL